MLSEGIMSWPKELEQSKLSPGTKSAAADKFTTKNSSSVDVEITVTKCPASASFSNVLLQNWNCWENQVTFCF